MQSNDRRRIEEVTRTHINAGKLDLFSRIGVNMVIAGRAGCYVHDISGERYLDVLCDGTTYNFGHRNPAIVETLKAALDRLDIGCQFLPSAERASLTEEIVNASPKGLDHVHYVASGSEANDAAIKAARVATGRRKIISIAKSFHGVTGLAANASDRAFWEPFGIGPRPDDFVTVPWNDIARMEAALGANDAAAVLMETVPATLGWPMPGDDYHRSVKALCERHGALLIMDEIQTGLGRSGRLWGLERWNARPDIMVVAKGIGGGVYPFAYLAMTERAAAWTRSSPLGMPSTFGGSELGCVVARKVLAMASAETTLSHVSAMARLLESGVAELQRQFPGKLLETRQLGLAAGLKFSDPVGGLKMMRSLFRHGVLALFAAYDPSVVQLKPPLIITAEQVGDLLRALGRAIVELDEPLGFGDDLGHLQAMQSP
jgi:acetylornithine/succinyldiaminopimelate/putrescine aminotransferase